MFGIFERLKDIWRECRRFRLLYFGFFCSLLAGLLYFYSGYSHLVLGLWVLGPLLVIYYLRRGEKDALRGEKLLSLKDAPYILGLLVLFLPVYFWNLYRIPWQVNTDEITIMFFMQKFTDVPAADLFSLSEYFYFPSFPFVLFGWIGKLLGGINLFHIRLIHASSGIFIILASYFLFKTLTHSNLFAAGGAVILGSNHALVAISRMAMRDNLALLFETASFALLIRGLQKRSALATFSGGALAGFTYYNYFPGRITAPLWALFLLFCFMFFRKEVGVKKFLSLGAVGAVGFLMIAGPGIAATLRTPGYGQTYAKEQILIFPEGRELERWWEGRSNAYEAMHINLINGLTAFNRPLHDHGYIYPNYGHGFVEPFTGILIWLGLAAFLLKGEKTKEGMFVVLGFLFLYLFFALLTTKNPNYTRTLVMLPFIAGLALLALSSAYSLIARLSSRLALIFFLIALSFVFASNMGLFRDFGAKGLREGNDVGSTGRYIEERASSPDYSFYLAASKSYPYYGWGEEGQWRTWVGFFASENQQVVILPPELVARAQKQTPFTIFASKQAFLLFEKEIKEAYPNLTVYPIKTDGTLLAVEVL